MIAAALFVIGVAGAWVKVVDAEESRVFLTSTVYDGNLGGLTGADQICEERATAGSLGGGPWVAWLSTSTTNAVDRLASYSGPFTHAVTGLTIAENIEDLTDGKLCNGIQRDEFGGSWIHFAWTGSLSDGTLGGGTCGDWTSGSRNASATFGFNPASDQTWTDNGLTQCTFYFESVLFRGP